MLILVAEDEPDIRKMYRAALEARGHEIVISVNGEECLNVYRENLREEPKRNNNNNKADNAGKEDYLPSSEMILSSPSANAFDVVILDYKMPKMNGMDVAKEILQLNPQQRIIFASAYVTEVLEDSIKELKQVVELLQKPFEISVLVDTIEDKEASKGLMKVVSNLRGIQDYDNPTPEQIRNIFEGLRKLQKGRITWS
jgi:CheY-like chemotaxis protein